ncbi:endo-1,4-beta-xylanase [Butyrivibrio sp. LC3010]|uniref:endo-1,4-beta-xylanase n=1 Tax=Butyrivibrio sp. LC3010 TaxID=1280680 RepID=UPI00040709CC|nr:endo-1,4-beta-xylanase [Butyrivibrio sp. LC3010]
MIMRKKTLIALALTMGLLAGCGNSNTNAASAESSSSASAQSASTIENTGVPGSSEAESDAANNDVADDIEEAIDASDDNDASDNNGSSENDESSDEQTKETIEDSLNAASLKDLYADNFMLGVGINGSTLENQTLNLPEYMELSKKHFNSCTMTNLMKSGYILDQQGSIESLKTGDGTPALFFGSIDPTLEWCKENGMKMRGHTLVWHTQTPGWFFREGYTDDGEYVDKDTMLMRMESYIKQLITHVQEEYPGVIYCWDVVNEAVEPDSYDPDSDFMCRTKCGEDPNPWYDTIGPDYVEAAFTYARKYADSDVKLFYNDYNTYQPVKTNAIYTLCESLKEKGLIDGIGMQGYWGIDYPSDQMIETAIRKFAELGLEIHITELSIGVDEETDEQFEKQGKRYGDVFSLLLSLDDENGGPANITSVTLFGLIDHYREGDTTNTRIFYSDYSPKPAFHKIEDLMKNN